MKRFNFQACDQDEGSEGKENKSGNKKRKRGDKKGMIFRVEGQTSRVGREEGEKERALINSATH